MAIASSNGPDKVSPARRPGLRLGLRFTLLVALLPLLALPWIGLRFVERMAELTRDSQWETQQAAARSLAASLHESIAGMHVVGYVENHPEVVWATFEHKLNAPMFAAPGRETALQQARRLYASFEPADREQWQNGPAVSRRADEPRTHVFLVGFPRSGTTLLENVLAAHPDAVSLEEKDSLEQTLLRSTKTLDHARTGLHRERGVRRQRAAEAGADQGEHPRRAVRRVDRTRGEPEDQRNRPPRDGAHGPFLTRQEFGSVARKALNEARQEGGAEARREAGQEAGREPDLRPAAAGMHAGGG